MPSGSCFRRLTLPRPPHPAPNVHDDRETPLSRDGTIRVLDLIWVRREENYFCKWDWTGTSVICPVEQITCRRRKLVQYRRALAGARLLAVSRQKTQGQWRKGTPLPRVCRQRGIPPPQTRRTLAAKQPGSMTPPTDVGDQARTKPRGRFEQEPR